MIVVSVTARVVCLLVVLCVESVGGGLSHRLRWAALLPDRESHRGESLSETESVVPPEVDNYNRALPPEVVEYDRALPPEVVEYDRALPPEVDEYDRALPPEVVEYDRALPPEVDEYDRALPPEVDEYDRALPPEVDEYDHVLPPKVAESNLEVGDHKIELPPKIEGHKIKLPPKIGGHKIKLPPKIGDHKIKLPPKIGDHKIKLPPEIGRLGIKLPQSVGDIPGEPASIGYNTNTGRCGIRAFDADVYRSNGDYARHLTPQRVRHGSVKPRVFGGHQAARGEFPWQAKLEQDAYPEMEGKYRNHLCGAVIISQYWLLSAAHCVKGARDYRIIVGDHKFKERDPSEQQFFVDKIIIHQKYSKKSKDYDIALIKIKPSQNGQFITFNKFVQPSCLADDRMPFIDGALCLVSGWGVSASNNANAVEILKGGIVSLINQTVCKDLLSGIKTRNITQRLFCASYLKGGADTCRGDSGGPLVCQVSGAYTLFGITSWGKGCGNATTPGVYVRVSEFIPWIVSQISLHNSTVAEATLPSRPGVM